MKKNNILAFLCAMLLASASVSGQVTIGDDNKIPESFSILELFSSGRGLRLPQLTSAERNAVTATTTFQTLAKTTAKGLTIFNMTTNCVEVWDGSQWIATCAPVPVLTRASALGAANPSDPNYGKYNKEPNAWPLHGDPLSDILYMTDQMVVTGYTGTSATGKWLTYTGAVPDKTSPQWNAATAFSLTAGAVNGTFPLSANSPNANYAIMIDSVVVTLTVDNIRNGSTAMPYLMIAQNTVASSGLPLGGFVFNDANTLTLGYDKNYELYENILLPVAAPAGSNWTPIAQTGVFSGTLDGNSHCVDNMTITEPSGTAGGNYYSLIGNLSGSVRNIAVTNINIYSPSINSRGGGITSNMNPNALIENCFTTGQITSYYYTGGIAGFVDKNTVIRNCYSSCKVGGGGDFFGGIVGGYANIAGTSQLLNCFATGSISSSFSSAGSVLGGANTGGSTISNCYALSDNIQALPPSYRFTGKTGGSSFSNNYGLTITLVNGAAPTDLPAAAVTAITPAQAIAKSPNHYATPGTWDFSIATGPWTFNYTAGATPNVLPETNLPVLKSFIGKVDQNPHINPCCAVSSVNITPTTGTVQTGATVLLTANLSPTVATGVSYVWQRSVNSGTTWETVAGATAATFNAPAVMEGVTQYRVVASNDCSAQTSAAVSITGTGSEAIPVDLVPYIGAFWKNDQRGERLIRMTRPTTATPTTADGAWTATVISGNWIVLDTLMTSDTGVDWNSAKTPADMNTSDASYRLPSTATTTVSGTMNAGTPQIYFRIGLTGTQASGSAPRYGMVLLTYANGTRSQRIWIRQGEEADYLMQPSDAINSGGFTGTGPNARPSAAKFSPYNLTVADAGLNTQAGINGANPNPGIFTQYPTQSGAFFQWAGKSFVRYAWDAYKSGAPTGTTQTTWDADTIPGHYWEGGSSGDLYLTHETCPPGYRRPTDGATDASTGSFNNPTPTNTNVQNSELRQSLWLNPMSGLTPTTENRNWGYYADGFFDRRQIVNGPGASPSSTKSTVSATNPTIANLGQLFYNNSNNASLFFPAAGNRNIYLYGGLFGVGDYGFYWSSSSNNNTSAWLLNFVQSATYVNDIPRAYGFNVRCVKDDALIPPVPPDPDTVTDNILPNSYVGAFWKANQTGERLIRIPRPTDGSADGDWTAMVLVGNSWIMLDKAMTNDPNVGWRSGAVETSVVNGNDTGFDNTYKLPTAASWFVRGTLSATNPYIYFRIGLKSVWSATTAAPARYGIVLLQYKGNTQNQRIWIRQGEEADYLMSNGEVMSGGLLSGQARTMSMQFSPYNLTVPDASMNQQVYKYGTTTAGTTASKFTDYPSQAGAYFQWFSNASPRLAFAPIPMATPTTWDSSNPQVAYWDTGVGADNETCPDGYRRPSGGPTDSEAAAQGSMNSTQMAKNEMVQSLFQNFSLSSDVMRLPAANIAFGYYADGFFDRRQIVDAPVTPTVAEKNCAVSTTTNNVAYRGMLFHNPNNYASIFFPATGMRAGSLNTSTGTVGSYYTSSACLNGDTYNWPNGRGLYMEFMPPYGSNAWTQASMLMQVRSVARSIRCVKKTIDVGPNSIWLSPSAGNTSKTVEVTSDNAWTVTQPTNATVTPTSGDAGTTNLTVTRSASVFGPATFTVKNNVTGEVTTVTVDNYDIDNSETLGLTNAAGVNTATFNIPVYGGDQTFTIVDKPSWVTATIVGSQLQLSANQSSDKLPRDGIITIAHGNDFTYQIQFTIVQSAMPPFDYLVLKFTWNLNDVDIAVEVTNPENNVLFSDSTITNPGYPARALGYGLSSAINLDGKTYGWSNPPSDGTTNDSTLLIWGGDATGGQGETVFLKAPLITPSDPRNDTQNYPRYITIAAYAIWWTSGRINNPVKLTLTTYVGGTMMKPGAANPNNDDAAYPPTVSGAPKIYSTNFYNVTGATNDNNAATGILGPNAWNYLNAPSFKVDSNLVINKQGTNQASNFRTTFTRLATITYDRYTRTALVVWNAAGATGAILPTGFPLGDGEPKPAPSNIPLNPNVVTIFSKEGLNGKSQ